MAIHLEMVSILAIFRGKQRDFCFVPQQVLLLMPGKTYGKILEEIGRGFSAYSNLVLQVKQQNNS